ncbi:hypothetical protein M434DRAFT_323412 [Hypoxylon sp. CO27-5]|nr:hypothetical protein M434DRAFT_323412 [Hypoxylon sp. CO27-5]
MKMPISVVGLVTGSCCKVKSRPRASGCAKEPHLEGRLIMRAVANPGVRSKQGYIFHRVRWFDNQAARNKTISIYRRRFRLKVCRWRNTTLRGRSGKQRGSIPRLPPYPSSSASICRRSNARCG